MQVLLVLLAVDAGRDVGDQVGEKIAKSLSHFSANENSFITLLLFIVITLKKGRVSEG